MIATSAIDAALRRIGENSFFHRSRANFLGNTFSGIERFARGLVAYEFDAKEKTETADFGNVTMCLKRSKIGLQCFCSRSDPGEQVVSFDIIENGVACRGGNRMRLVSKSMFENAGTAFNRFDHVARRLELRRAERSRWRFPSR